jgi:hypothetical protein
MAAWGGDAARRQGCLAASQTAGPVGPWLARPGGYPRAANRRVFLGPGRSRWHWQLPQRPASVVHARYMPGGPQRCACTADGAKKAQRARTVKTPLQKEVLEASYMSERGLRLLQLPGAVLAGRRTTACPWSSLPSSLWSWGGLTWRPPRSRSHLHADCCLRPLAVNAFPSEEHRRALGERIGLLEGQVQVSLREALTTAVGRRGRVCACEWMAWQRLPWR